MTFQGDNIGDRPSRELVEIYVGEKGYMFNIDDFYAYWDKKKWRSA